MPGTFRDLSPDDPIFHGGVSFVFTNDPLADEPELEDATPSSADEDETRSRSDFFTVAASTATRTPGAPSARRTEAVSRCLSGSDEAQVSHGARRTTGRPTPCASTPALR